MALVIAEPCTTTCNQECVDVCPVEAIHGPVPVDEIRAVPHSERAARFASLRLYIDPGNCICCNACEPECPTRAIYDENALPPAWAHHREANARFFRK